MARPSSKPTMDDVARRAGVSRSLVSLALSGSDRVADSSRRAVQTAADELGYRPNLIARNLASKKTRTIGLVLNDLHNPYFPEIADGIKRAADRFGYRLLLNSAFLDDSGEVAALDTFIDFQVDGIILVGSRATVAEIERAASAVPLVVASRPIDSELLDTVNNDDRSGAARAVQHLIDLGHRHIWHLDGGAGAGADQRREGYRSTMLAQGFGVTIERADFTEASGVAATERLLAGDRECTAIFAGNDLCALGALDVVDRHGYRVPEDISIVGYDNTYIAALRHIGLTSVDQQGEALGVMAIEALIERIDGGRRHACHQVIDPTLVVRDTTGPASSGRSPRPDSLRTDGQTVTVSASSGSGGSPAPCTD